MMAKTGGLFQGGTFRKQFNQDFGWWTGNNDKMKVIKCAHDAHEAISFIKDQGEGAPAGAVGYSHHRVFQNLRSRIGPISGELTYPVVENPRREQYELEDFYGVYTFLLKFH